MTDEPESPRNETLRSLDRVIGFRLRRMQGLFQAHWQLWLGNDHLGITPVQGGILLLIDENSGLSQVSLARLMRIEAPTLHQALKPLLQKKLVGRRRSARDSRAFSLALTDLGQDMAAVIRAETPKHEDDLLKALTPRERARLLSLLDKAILSGEASVDIVKAVRSAGGWRLPNLPEQKDEDGASPSS